MLRNKLGLNANGIFSISDLNNYKQSSTCKIAESNDLVLQMKKEVEKWKKLLELSENDRIEVIKNEVFYYDFGHCLEKAKDYFDAKKDNKVREKNQSENKKFFDFLVSRIKEMLGYDITITGFMSEGWEHYNDCVLFDCEGLKMELVIPDMSKFCKKFFDYMHEGKIVLFYQKQPYSWDWIAGSYDEEEIKTKFQEFMVKKNS